MDLQALKTIFEEQGYVVVPRFADNAITQSLRLIAEEHLATELAPMEYEVDVQYPGAPADAEALGAGGIDAAAARQPLVAAERLLRLRQMERLGEAPQPDPGAAIARTVAQVWRHDGLAKEAKEKGKK